MTMFQSCRSDEEKLATWIASGYPAEPGGRPSRFVRMFQPRIVIIGAGAAGLAAAEYLAENGLTNVVLLEAQDRIGGRVWSRKVEQGHVEMGAQFIHSKSALYDVAERNKFIKAADGHTEKEVDPTSEHGSGGEFLVEGGFEVTPTMKAIFNETYEVIGSIFSHCKTGDANATDDDKCNIGQWMKEQFDLFLAGLTDEADEIKTFRLSILGWIMRVHRSDNACESLYDLPVSEYAKYAGSMQCIPVQVPMFHILKLTLAKSPVSKVKLNKPVQQIRFMDDTAAFPIHVVCKDGDVFEADHCIVTASLGFLKHNVETFFQPQLPAAKTRAIREAGFGTVNKVILRFNAAFWEESYGCVDGFQLLYPDLDDTQHDLSDRPWHRAILGFDVCKTLPNTLIGWLCGKQARDMETLSDDEVAQQCQAVLQKFLKLTEVPRPVEVIRANWYHNQYTRGSFSYAAVNQSDHIKVLAEPCWYYRSAASVLGQQVPGLLFAGEATHSTLFSTVPGAVESGQREAERIIVLYTKS